jgi:hypothetical protein
MPLLYADLLRVEPDRVWAELTPATLVADGSHSVMCSFYVDDWLVAAIPLLLLPDPDVTGE